MVKKVTLDRLDIEEDEISLKEKPPEVGEESKDKPAKWFASKRFLLSSLVVAGIILVAGGSLTYRWLTIRKVQPRVSAEKMAASAPSQPAAVPLPLQQRTELVNDFLVPVRDDKGNARVVVCDLAIELNDNQKLEFMENMVRIRSLIYETVRKKRALELIKPEGRSLIRDEISAELCGFLGEDAVKAVYFTKFVVL